MKDGRSGIERSRYDDQPDRATVWVVVGLVVLALLLGTGVWWWTQRGAVPELSTPAARSAGSAGPAVQDGVPVDRPDPAQADSERFPIEDVAPEADASASTLELPQLPALDDSDQALLEALSARQPVSTWESLLVPQGLIRRIVATVDNLPREQVAQQILPLQPAPETFRASTAGGELRVAPDNAARYARHVQAMEAIDTRALVAIYVRWYPLFQRAYRDLGYPRGHFNDRLVTVIDHLLATPTINEPLALTQPKVLYEFADPALESRSAGQKMLLRMGPDNAGRVKAKLLEIRQALAGQGRAPPR